MSTPARDHGNYLRNLRVRSHYVGVRVALDIVSILALIALVILSFTGARAMFAAVLTFLSLLFTRQVLLVLLDIADTLHESRRSGQP